MLRSVAQEDFSLGVVRLVARELIARGGGGKRGGAYDVVNGLLSDEGAVFKRGGTSYRSGSALGASGTLLFAWDGYLEYGRANRTVFGGASVSAALAVDDSTVLDLTGVLGGLQVTRPVVVDGFLWLSLISAGTPFWSVYAGSLKTAAYTTGTVTVTNGSAVVTGAGTSWLANVDVGMILNKGGRIYIVRSVDSDTQVTLNRVWAGTTSAGGAYTLTPAASQPTPTGYPRGGTAMAVVAGRLLFGGVREEDDTVHRNRVRFSNSALAGGQGPQTWDATDFYDLPAGVEIVALQGIQNTLLIFTTQGVFTVTGLENDLTDAFGNVQHRVQKTNDDLICWNDSGIATWRNTPIVPTLDSVWLFDSVGAPRNIGEPLQPLYQSYVSAGYRPGGACVFRGHYFLPILDSASTTVIDVLVCRLATGSWTRFAGAGAQVSMFAPRQRVGVAPVLLGAQDTTGRRLMTCSYFAPAAGTNTDVDGAGVTMTLKGPYAQIAPVHHKALVKKVRARQELVSAGGVATVTVSLVTPAGTVALASGAESDGASAYSAQMSGSPSLRTQRAAVELTNAGDPADSWTVRSVEMYFRPSQKV